MLELGSAHEHRPGTGGFSCKRLDSGYHLVELWDDLPIDWLGNFSRATAQLAIDIASGHARRSSATQWSARFVARSIDGHDLTRTDFLSLAHSPPIGGALEPLALEAFMLEHDEQLMLRIRARDRVGLLASLLNHLAGFVLFADKLELDTRAGEAHDTLWLCSVGRQPPTAALASALRKSLDNCLARGASKAAR